MLVLALLCHESMQLTCFEPSMILKCLYSWVLFAGGLAYVAWLLILYQTRFLVWCKRNTLVGASAGVSALIAFCLCGIYASISQIRLFNLQCEMETYRILELSLLHLDVIQIVIRLQSRRTMLLILEVSLLGYFYAIKLH